MFFLLSKVGWLLIAPSTLLTVALVAGLMLMRWTPFVKLGRRVAMAAAAVFAFVIVLPVGDWLERSLEQRFPKWSGCTGSGEQPVAGIILLGGGLQSIRVDGRVEEMLNDAADRIRYAGALARQHPGVPVLISGGQVFTRPGMRSEAESMADMLVELGVTRDRIKLESGSRTTAENATLVKSLAVETKGSWLLVTSGYHMPRSMGVFRHAGVPVIAAPTDWHIDDDGSLVFFSVSNRLYTLDGAVHEYVGLIGYRLGGKTDVLFPSPAAEAVCPSAVLPTRAKFAVNR